MTAAGRTDAGVHAVGQVISFTGHDAFPVERLGIALNSALPPDLSVRDCARVAQPFSARHSALERRYEYVILNRAAPSAVARRFAHFEHRPIDVVQLNRAAQTLLGTHDFLSFCGVPPENGGPTVRTLRVFEAERRGEFVVLRFCGDGFLHRMVRVMTGTLLEIATGRRSEDELPRILAARDRRSAGLTAPACGLFLAGVHYLDFDSGRALQLPQAF